VKEKIMNKLSEKIKYQVFDDWSVSVYKTLNETETVSRTGNDSVVYLNLNSSDDNDFNTLGYDVVVNYFDIDDVDVETFENKNRALERFDDIVFESLDE
jgi:hypothetical protein